MRAIKWFLINGGFAVLLYFGAVQGIAGAQNVFVAFTWLIAVLSPGLLTDDYVKQHGEKLRKFPVPSWLAGAFDLLVMGALAWFAWWWTLAAYFVHWVCLMAAIEKAKKV